MTNFLSIVLDELAQFDFEPFDIVVKKLKNQIQKYTETDLSCLGILKSCYDNNKNLIYIEYIVMTTKELNLFCSNLDLLPSNDETRCKYISTKLNSHEKFCSIIFESYNNYKNSHLVGVRGTNKTYALIEMTKYKQSIYINYYELQNFPPDANFDISKFLFKSNILYLQL